MRGGTVRFCSPSGVLRVGRRWPFLLAQFLWCFCLTGNIKRTDASSGLVLSAASRQMLLLWIGKSSAPGGSPEGFCVIRFGPGAEFQGCQLSSANTFSLPACRVPGRISLEKRPRQRAVLEQEICALRTGTGAEILQQKRCKCPDWIGARTSVLTGAKAPGSAFGFPPLSCPFSNHLLGG